jgi:hypothetical protein
MEMMTAAAAAAAQQHKQIGGCSWLMDLAIHPYTSKALERENLMTTTMIIIPIAMSSAS